MNKDRIWTLLSRKLSGEATLHELIELNDLIKEFPDAEIPVLFANEYWNLPKESDEEFLDATFYLHCQRLKEQGFDLDIVKHETGSLNIDTPVRKKKKLLMWSAVLGLLLFFSGIFYNLFNSTSGKAIENFSTAHSEVSTKNGSRTKIQLPDGTSVWLNSNSNLTYDNQHFGTAIREVNLVGEAYFDVVRNPEKPFIIHTDKMDIKVLGTAFNVKCYPGEKKYETSLIRGRIEVTLKDRAEKIILKPNEKLILNTEDIKLAKSIPVQQKLSVAIPIPIIELGHLTLFPSDNSVVETAWVQNKLVFNSETFEEIAVKMERWYGVTIIIKDEKLKKVILTGSFEKETITQALNALQLTTVFTYKVDKDIITISK